jgi:hypothetical protein
MTRDRPARTADEQFAPGPVDYKMVSDMDLLEALRDLDVHRAGETHEQTAFAIWRLLTDARDPGDEDPDDDADGPGAGRSR